MTLEILSAESFIALLNEKDTLLQHYALKKLDDLVDEYWAEISEHIHKIENLFNVPNSSYSDLAALLLSKIYYHLGRYKESLSFMLLSGSCFNVETESQFVVTLICKCIEYYITLRTEQYENNNFQVNERLKTIMDQIFLVAIKTGDHKQVIGISIEARRLDIFETVLVDSNLNKELMNFSFNLCMSSIRNKNLKKEILGILIKLYSTERIPSYNKICQCLVHLRDVEQTESLLQKLIKSSKIEDNLVGLQMCFDIYENAPQSFVVDLIKKLEERMIENEKEEFKKVFLILSGNITVNLYREFLSKNSKTDTMILQNIKRMAGNNAICHNAVVISNGLLHFGTANHSFLQENLEWLSRAQNWSKFTATASIGLIHQGSVKDSLKVLSSYLPREDTNSPYSEGGSLFALGLIHANNGSSVRNRLFEYLKSPSIEILHGASLGIGVALIGSGDKEIYNRLFEIFESDDAIAGEAATIAIGLIQLGSSDMSCIQRLLEYARMTQHEKIIRGIAFAVSFILYQQEEEADDVINELCLDKDSNIRLCGMLVIAMAYIGTNNKKALIKLLHYTASDSSDDVRRAAASSIGFIMYPNPEQCSSLVSSLINSYSSHVRYGAAMALGVSCAGTGLTSAINLLEPLVNDPSDFVRQGVFIAMGMIMIRQFEGTASKSDKVRKILEKVYCDKRDDPISRMGAIIGQGIIDAGGRNVTISLANRFGNTSSKTAVGLLLFQQYWYWFPLTSFLSLALSPTALITINSDFKVPILEFKSNCKPSLFAYPPNLEKPKEPLKKKIKTTVLSVTEKRKKKNSKKKKVIQKENEKEDTDQSEKKEIDRSCAMEIDAPKKESMNIEEPAYEILQNPAPVGVYQLKYIELIDGDKYETVRELGGIVIVKTLSDEVPMLVHESYNPIMDADEKNLTEECNLEEIKLPEAFEYDEE